MRCGSLLTAEWRHLAMLSYAIDPAALLPHLPRGTELDTWRGQTYVTLVGFTFRCARLFRLPIPFYRAFGEVNLRFYARRRVAGGWRPGVVFLKEIVPHRAVAAVARLCFHESFVALPLRYAIVRPTSAAAADGAAEYRWCHGGAWKLLRVRITGPALFPDAGSLEQFIVGQHWAFTRRRDGGTTEYRVDHPRWRIRPAAVATLDGDLAALYGSQFGSVLAGPPACAFVADGSPVVVRRGVPLASGRRRAAVMVATG